MHGEYNIKYIEVCNFIKPNSYVKFLLNFMHTDDEQLYHSTPHSELSMMWVHSLQIVPSFYT
jgi:hypothetical protein